MKYKAIYDVLEQSDTHIVYENSGWRAVKPAYIDHIRPLWIVAESPRLGLRLWITHENGKLSVTIADMNCAAGSRAYHESLVRKTFRKQAELAALLRELLLPQKGGVEKCAS